MDFCTAGLAVGLAALVTEILCGCAKSQMPGSKSEITKPE